LPFGGLKVLQAWAADGAGNISLFPHRARINYIPPGEHIARDQVHLFRQLLTAGQRLTVRVTPVQGDPDLYVWEPDPDAPPWVSNLEGGLIDEVSFVAPRAGVYQIEVYGYTAAQYTLEIAITGTAAQAAGGQAHHVSMAKPVRSSPLIPVSSEPPEHIAMPAAPTPEHTVYLPVVTRGTAP
jgi:hypothetical protein